MESNSTIDLENGDISKIAEKLCSDLIQSKGNSTQIFTVVHLLESLGALLTDAVSVSRRQRGLAILSSVICKLPQEFLPSDDCRLLSSFYCDRTKDHHSLNPEMIMGMHGLAQCINLDAESLRKLLQTYFNEISTQSQMLQERKQVFQLLSGILHTKLDLILPMGNDFVLGFIQAVDGEKDPNNLMLIFRCVPLIVRNFPLEPFTEDLFETIARYFPIDFTPPRLPAGLQVVTKTELVVALRHCFASDKSFAPLAIPLFLEKLDSDLDDSKIDANLSLVECLQSGYTSHQIGPHLEEMWNLYKKEIMGFKLGKSSGKDEEVRKTSLTALNAITRQLSLSSISGLVTSEERQILTGWIEKIWEDCGRHLKDIGRSGGEELTLTSKSIDILSALTCGTGDYASNHVLNMAMPVILEAVQKSTLEEDGVRSARLNYITKMIDGSSISENPRSGWYDLYLHECIVSAFAPTSENPKNNKVGCLAIAAGMHFLGSKDAENIFEQLFKQTVNEGRKIGEAEKYLLISLIRKLDYALPSNEQVAITFQHLSTDETGELQLESCMEFIDVCCQCKVLLDGAIFPKVLDMISSINDDAAKFYIVVRLLQSIWDIHKDTSYFTNSTDTTLSVLEQTTNYTQSMNITYDNKSSVILLTALKKLIACVSPKLTADNKETVENILREFVTSNESKELCLDMKDNLYVFEMLLCFSSKMLLNSLEPQIYEAVYSKATDNLLAGDAVKAEAILKIRAALFNKLSPISAYEKEMYQRCNASQTDVMRTQAIWLIKGLFLRAGFFKLNTWIQLLQRWLCELDPTMVNLLADEICEILITPNESDEYSFFDYNESAISLMRQKLFLISKQGLVDAYNKDLNKAAQMKILISQLPHIPKFLLREEMLSFIPLLINALKGYHSKVTFLAITRPLKVPFIV